MSDKGSINNITLPVYKKLKAECSVVRTETGITELSDAVLSKLKCGDIVCKEDSSGKHSYIVSFKKDGVGICLTYADGSGYIETVSYDFTEGHWVYNSTDIFNGSDIKGFDGDIKVTAAAHAYIASNDIPSSSGLYRLISGSTIVGCISFTNIGQKYVSGLYMNHLFTAQLSSGNFVFDDHYLQLGTKLYNHSISFTYSGFVHTVDVISTESKALNNVQEFSSLNSLSQSFSFDLLSILRCNHPRSVGDTSCLTFRGGVTTLPQNFRFQNRRSVGIETGK